MKKLLMFAFVATFAFGATALVATDSDARARGEGILGSAHDFTDDLSAEDNINEWAGPAAARPGTVPGTDEAGGWNYRGEVCRVCHSPHDKGKHTWANWDGVDSGLLWNHALSDTAAYASYASDSLAGEIAGNVVGKSKLCLSCHDGTVAINAFDGQATNSVNTTTGVFNRTLAATDIVMADYDDGFEIGPGRAFSSPSMAAGGGVANDFLMGNHPISVAYLAGGPDGTWVANPKIVDPAAPTIVNERSGEAMPMGGGLWNPIGKTFGMFEPMTFAPTVDMVLEKGMVQCHSCHDVHDAPGVNSIGTRLNRAGQGMAANRGGDPSGLCLSCHAK